MGFLSEQDNKAIEATVKKAEAGTSGEIVFAAAQASSHYHHANLQGALIGMAMVTILFMMIPYIHITTNNAWSDFVIPIVPNPTNLLCTEAISFAAFLIILPHWPWRRWIISKQEMNARVHEAAFMQFYSSGLYKTRESNGVEIYLSLFERKVVVIGDQGIHEKMGDEHWDRVRNLIIQGIKRGDACSGICAAIESCGKALAEHFPPRPDDINELPDQVIIRPLDPNSN
jgi:putative membrane protein